jgi:type II secretory pathway pseudopilin PulG
MRQLRRDRQARATGSLALRARGFTLIELAVGVLVVMLLVGSILVPLATQVRQRKTADTQRALDEIREALIGYAMINRRLPRPAKSATDGTEKDVDCADDTACTGFIPWTTLGVSGSDAYGKLIRYSVTPAFSNATPFTLSSTPNRIVQTRQSVSPFGLVTLVSGVPAIIWSQGAEGGGTSADGQAQLDDSATNLDEDVNSAATVVTAISRGPSEATATAGGEFDDIVTWVSASLLINRMVSAGRLP